MLEMDSIREAHALATKELESMKVAREQKAKEHNAAIEKLQKEHEIALTQVKEQMTEQVIKAQETMSAALQEQTGQEEVFKKRVSSETLALVHDSLEGLLKNTFLLEDGSRLSSLESYKAGQAPLESLLDEFTQLMEQLDLQKRDNGVVERL